MPRRVGPFLLFAALLAGAADAQPAAAPPPRAQPPPPSDLENVAVAELNRCLTGQRWTLGPGYAPIPVDQAEGLPGGMRVARVATPAGRLVVYEDNGEGSVIECGVALYGVAPAGMADAFRQAIARDKPGYASASPDFWRLGGADPTSSTYWGVSGAPGLYGVLLRQFSDPASPVIQVDSHRILVR